MNQEGIWTIFQLFPLLTVYLANFKSFFAPVNIAKQNKEIDIDNHVDINTALMCLDVVFLPGNFRLPYVFDTDR